jgi:hypothetical protein
MQGKKLKEIAREQGITEMGACKRIQRAAKGLGLENIDEIRRQLFDDTFTDFHRSVKLNLQRLDSPVTIAYGKGMQIFREKSDVELSGNLTIEEANKLREQNISKTIDRLKLKVVEE